MDTGNIFRYDDDTIYKWIFWHGFGDLIIIVAVIKEDGYWSAYKGFPTLTAKLEDNITWIAKHGEKLGHKDALHFFPDGYLPYIDEYMSTPMPKL